MKINRERNINKKFENLKKYYIVHRSDYKDYNDYKQRTLAYLLLKLADRNISHYS